MDQVKKGSKTLLDFFFQPSSAKKKSKGLDSPMPGPSTKDLNYATPSFKIGKSPYLRCDEKSSDNRSPSK